MQLAPPERGPLGRSARGLEQTQSVLEVTFAVERK